MKSRFLARCLLIILGLSGAIAYGHTGSCNPVESQTLDENVPLYIHEAPTFRAFGKRFSTSSQLKNYFDQQKKLLKQLEEEEIPVDAVSQMKIAAVGDVMRLPGKQPDFVDDILKEHLATIDVLTGNLETLISDKYPVPPDSLFMMNSDPSLLTAFQSPEGHNYFSVLSMANNHTFDFPDDAIRDTLGHLNEQGIWQSGIRLKEGDKPYLVFEHNGIRIGYYAVTTFVNRQEMFKKSEVEMTPMVKGIEPVGFSEWKSSCEIDLSDIKKVLGQMKQDGADIRIVSIHWGIDHDMYPQPVQLEIAHKMVQYGADVIVGSHPHVPQPAEICFLNGYEARLGEQMAETQRQRGCVMDTLDGVPRKAMVYYSLGNFSSYSPFFWQQVGTIAQMNLVQRNLNNQRVVDWFAPKYVFTYDHVTNPPNGKRHLNLLNTYIARGCDQQGCSAETKNLVGVLNRHLYGKSFTWWEEIRYVAITTYQATKNYFYWKFVAP